MKVGINNQLSVSENLQRFQQVRDLARQRMEGADARKKVMDLIQEKQGRINDVKRDLNAKPSAAASGANAKTDISIFVNKTLQKANELLRYTADSKNEPESTKTQTLGNYIDLVA